MKNATRSTRRQRGFTLVEACAVIGIVSILATAALPNLQGLVDGRRLDGAATQLATDIQFVRSEAVARNLPVRLSFYPSAGGSCYVVHTGNAEQCACDTSGPATCSGDAQQIKTVAFTAADRVSLQSNAASVLFDPLHGTSTPTGTLRVIGQQGRAVHHVINVMGRVRSCSPQGAMPGYRVC
jgi:type IV fimbrial biogenesis protein FimT